MTRLRLLALACVLGAALPAPRAADADRRVDALAGQPMPPARVSSRAWSSSSRLPAPLRALLSRFLDLEPPRPEAALDDELDAEQIDRARASRRAERERHASAGAARDARRASGPSNP